MAIPCNVQKVMAIMLLCESAQHFRALMSIWHYHKTLSMISMMLSQSSISYAFETSQILSPVLFAAIPINSLFTCHKNVPCPMLHSALVYCVHRPTDYILPVR